VYALPMRRFAKRRIGRTLTNVGYISGSLLNTESCNFQFGVPMCNPAMAKPLIGHPLGRFTV
jgi:hypothetical protein